MEMASTTEVAQGTSSAYRDPTNIINNNSAYSSGQGNLLLTHDLNRVEQLRYLFTVVASSMVTVHLAHHSVHIPSWPVKLDDHTTVNKSALGQTTTLHEKAERLKFA
jgi:hypothetical protein